MESWTVWRASAPPLHQHQSESGLRCKVNDPPPKKCISVIRARSDETWVSVSKLACLFLKSKGKLQCPVENPHKRRTCINPRVEIRTQNCEAAVLTGSSTVRLQLFLQCQISLKGRLINYYIVLLVNISFRLCVHATRTFRFRHVH